jgi:hypothetical protein
LTSTKNQVMKCPVENCIGRFSTVNILAQHIAEKKTSSAHKRWMVENGITNTSRLNEELVTEIVPVLESIIHYNRDTKLYEFV